MRTSTRSWTKTLAALGLRLIERTIPIRLVSQEERRLPKTDQAFFVETLEIRQMLSLAEAPLPSPVNSNPCDPAIIGNSLYDLGGSSQSAFSGSVGSGNVGSSGTSSSGVRYFDGMVGATSMHVQSDALDGAFGIATTWTGYQLLSNDLAGSGISNPFIPKLISIVDRSVMLVASGSTISWFDANFGTNTYTQMFFGHDTLTHNSGTQELVYVDSIGNKLTFYDQSGGTLALQIKSAISPGGIATNFVYHTSGGLAGKLDNVNRNGTFNSLYAEERFVYTYNANNLVDKISWDQRSSPTGSWTTRRIVAYEYYGASDPNGTSGQLMRVTVKDASETAIDTTYLRYHSSALLKYFFKPVSYDRLVQAVGNPLTASDSAVAPYADAYFEFDSSARVTTAILQGEGCSSCTGGLGEFTYTYVENGAPASPADTNDWIFKTVETLPDRESKNVVYANGFGEPLVKVFREPTGTLEIDTWKMYTRYDADGRIALQADTIALTSYDETAHDLIDYANPINGLADGLGLVVTYAYQVSGAADGYYKSTGVQQGEFGSGSIVHEITTYTERSIGGVTVVYPSKEKVFRGSAGGSESVTDYSYTYHANVVAPMEITISYDAVAETQNGSGTSITESLVYNEFADLIWTRDGSGYVTYLAYDLATGGLTQTIVDVNSYSGLPQQPSWPLNGGGLHLTSTHEVDFFGRMTKSTDPNGNVDYVVYRDVQHEVRSYGGWNSGTDTATLPTVVMRFDRASGYSETIVMSAAPAVSGGRPTGTESIASIENWSRSYTNAGGQVTHGDQYFNLVGLTYSTSPSIGVEKLNFMRTRYSFDSRGRLERVEEPQPETAGAQGTIHRYIFDRRSRVVAYWKGTDDIPTSGIWDPENNTAETNLVQVYTYEYDGGGFGNSNLTKMVAHSGTATYTWNNKYDFRNRLVEQWRPAAIVSKYTYSNLDEITQVELYSDVDGTGNLGTNELRARAAYSFDDLGRVFRSSVYEVDPAIGTVGDRLTTNFWYDPRGNLAKTASPNGLFSKTLFDGAGRPTTSFLSIDSAESTYAAALTASGDTVIEQSTNIYDPGSRLVTTISLKRLESDTTSTGLLTYGNGYRNVDVSWYDRADRLTHATTFGRDDGSTRYVINSSNQLIDSDADGIPNEAEGLPRAVNSSDDWITAETQYDTAGRAFWSIDNLGRITNWTFDALNRVTRVIRNYVDGQITETELATDQRVAYEYLAAGQLSLVRNFNAKGTGNGVERQVTKSRYESTVDRSWATSVIYPDSSDTRRTGSDHVKYFFDTLGRLTQMVDQRGVDHRYHYDWAGRFWVDRIVNSIPGVDLSVRRLELTFDVIGRLDTASSFNAGSAGNVVNQVDYAYNSWGLVSQTKQAHDGAVSGSTPAITYELIEGTSQNGEVPFVRLSKVDYPGGQDVFYLYPSSGIGNALNRVESISEFSDGATKFAQYTYLGADTIVKIANPQTTNGLILSYGAAGIYSGWDRFGRIIEQKWTDNATTVYDHETYAYDRNSNMTSRTNVLRPALNESYSFDGLDRLSSMTRGGAAYQNWILDGAANWASFTNQGSTQSRTHNAANEVSTISGQNVPTHDAAGNLTQAPKPSGSGDQVYVWDGWNRLKQVKETGGTVIATYEYDARSNRIEKIVGANTFDYFYNESSQIVEVRLNDDPQPLERYVWDLSFVDTPVVGLRDTNMDGTLDGRMYYLWDATRNVTAVMFANGTTVAERMHYDAYGKVQFYTTSWGTKPGTSYGTVHTFTGRELDAESGLYYFRARYWDPALGRFIARDPIGYVDGMNLYQGYFVHGGVDPSGMRLVRVQMPDGYTGPPDDGRLPNGEIIPPVFTGKMAESDDAVVGYHVGGRHFDTYWGAQKAKVFQAGANAAYGVQSGLESVNNFVIGLGTALLPPARNFYRNFGFLGHTPDWSRDRFVPESDFGHKATTILGSLGIETIFGYGIARVARFFQLPSQGAQVRPREGIYEFPDVHAANKPYVGQSGNLARRLDQHAGVGRFAPGTESATEVLGGKTAREIAEHNRIQQLTGGQKAKNSPNVSNKCDPIGPERRPKLGIPEPRD